ncbi:MAG: alpha-L-fucosidase [Sedimentisphaerales bacterium]|nr:alpha-L-fucosidase [Sedimentisphaerales bacterium]
MFEKGIIYIGIVFCLSFSALARADSAPSVRYEPTWKSLDTRPIPAWFNEAKFGIFVVWGPYSAPAWKDRGYAEWYGWDMRQENSPTWKFHRRVYGADFKYEQFAERFKAELWNPDQWVDLFVRAGAKYVVTTANYHDGFCLYPSQFDATTETDRWNSTEVGPMRDILGELNEAGRKRGLKMGMYYSLYEWFHPLWLNDRQRYVIEKFHPQFKEVITQYKPPVIFLDGDWEMDYKQWKSEELCAWLFNDSPVAQDVVVNDRWGQCRGEHGSFFESEYGGGTGWRDHPWQEDRGIGHSYGYNRNETVDDYDTRQELLQMLSRVAGHGGNFLLDVGPTADGRIPVIMQERLVQIGEWLRGNGEAIYGSLANPFLPRRFSWGTCTYKPGRIYVHLWNTRMQEVRLPGLKNKVDSCTVLTDQGHRPLAFTQTDRWTTIALPDHLWLDDAVAIVVLEIAGEPDIDTAISQDPDGTVTLTAMEAQIHGSSPRYEAGNKDQIGYWGNPEDSVSWAFHLDREGVYAIRVTYSCATGAADSAYIVTVGKQQICGRTQETGAWDKHRTDNIGPISLSGPGEHRLTVKPATPLKWNSMGLRSVRLVLQQ